MPKWQMPVRGFPVICDPCLRGTAPAQPPAAAPAAAKVEPVADPDDFQP